ncbi:MAG: CBS domain-containing protein [Deltaproteobacteria bacterium]|nr:CBS domain-containing protein [Deltaproteobacteria bacterium]
MFVGKRMTKKVITVGPEDTLEQAASLLAGHRIHRLPVVRDGRLVGIVSDSDIRNAAVRPVQPETGPVGSKTVGEIMTREVITVTPWDTVEDALLILQKKRLGALPVVEGSRVIGIITKADVLAALVETLDIEGIGARIEVLLPRDIASVRKLVGLISEKGIEVRSIVLAPHNDRFAAFLRLVTIDVPSVKDTLRKAGFTIAELEDFLG